MNPIITEMTKAKTWKAYIQGNPDVCEFGEREIIAVAKLMLRLQGKHISTISGAFLLSVVCWLSWLALSWLFILEVVRMEAFAGTMWGLFLMLGIFMGAFATRR